MTTSQSRFTKVNVRRTTYDKVRRFADVTHRKMADAVDFLVTRELSQLESQPPVSPPTPGAQPAVADR